MATAGFGQTASFSVDDSSGCAPFTMVFTNTSTGFDSVHWDFDDGTFASSINANHIYYSIGEYNVTLYVYDSLLNVDSSTQTIYVASTSPYINVDDQACPGSLTSFEVQGNFDSDNTVLWDFGDGFTSNQANTEHAYADTGIYNVVLTFGNSACGVIVISDSILISNSLIPEVHIHPDGGSTMICPGSPFPFFYDENLSIMWDFGEGTSTNDPYPVFQYDSVGTYVVTVTTTNSCGNSNTLDTIITVDSTLIPQHAIYASSTTICPNDTVSLYPISVKGYSFEWFFDNGDSATGGNVFTSFNDTGIYTVSLAATNACGNTSIATKDILVSESIVPLGSLYIPTKVVCPDESVKFICTKKNATYLWYFGDGDSANTKSINHSYGIAGTYPIELIISNYCGQTTILYDTVIVDSTLTPESGFFLNQSSYCSGDEVIFKPVSSAYFTHYWDFGDGNTDTISKPLHTFGDTGAFQVSHITVNSCGNTDTATSIVKIDSFGFALANFEILTGNWVCPESPINFSNLSSNINSCLWYFDDGDSSAQANPIHSYAFPGNYLVTLSLTNSCGNVSTITKLVTVTNSALLPAPLVTCDANTLPLIYSWIPVPGALGYEVSEDSGTVWIANNGVGETHTIVSTWEAGCQRQ